MGEGKDEIWVRRGMGKGKARHAAPGSWASRRP